VLDQKPYVWSLVIGTTVLYHSHYYPGRNCKGNRHHAFVVNTDGSVIPLKNGLFKRKSGVKFHPHLELFPHLFYNIVAQQLQKNCEKHFGLGNSSVDAFKAKTSVGSIIGLLQYSWLEVLESIRNCAIHEPYTSAYHPIRKSIGEP